MPTIWQKIQEKAVDLLQQQRLVYQQHQGESFVISEWEMRWYRNTGARNHWLQLQLIGADGNRPAIGIRAEILSASGTQHQQVGQADTSLRSQRHYRMYFGLGKDSRVNALNILWPDGYLQHIEVPEADQLVTIKRDPTVTKNS
ncbi:MAG: hypothetical protein F6K42_00805 [Leptolyngbya sp. SIO1D8]|nr:hypothetical protein [Leptolyngbya sp. SIO1D8]